PIDVTRAVVPSQHFRHRLVHGPVAITPPHAELMKAVRLIDEGKKVTLFCGVGCREARAEVLTLARRLQAPIVHTLKAKDIFDYDDPSVVGMTGVIGNPAGYHAVRDCDVLVMLGTNFPYGGFIPDGIQIIQVDLRIENLGRRAPITLGLVGTARETVAALAEMVAPKASDHFVKALGRTRDQWLREMEGQGSPSRTDEPLHPRVFARQSTTGQRRMPSSGSTWVNVPSGSRGRSG
ncbi:MAG: hypothetical protein ACREOS_11820, partial [Candidatus Dormibacteraceae bacterium]